MLGKRVCFTGAFSVPRSEIETKAKLLGAVVLTGVSKNVDILVAGLDAGSKLAKANGMGLTTMTEDAFRKLGGS